jgi:hypothetical protein
MTYLSVAGAMLENHFQVFYPLKQFKVLQGMEEPLLMKELIWIEKSNLLCVADVLHDACTHRSERRRSRRLQARALAQAAECFWLQ